ncbi:MAG: hypothetical protein QOG53_3131 [Frankiales bacterium]|nr:hypothetical protein [Frankiales bacterium]
MAAPTRIVLVDPDGRRRAHTRRTISTTSAAVTIGEAVTYEEALAMLGSTEPECAIVQHSLDGGLTGLDLLHALRTTEVTRTTHVVGTSRYPRVAASYRRIGAGFIHEPIDPVSLSRELQRVRRA